MTVANPVAPVQDELQNVRKNVSKATIILLVVLTLASVVNLYEMAIMTHAANWFTALGVACGIGATLAVLAYVASVTDGKVRWIVTCFAVVAAGTSATLQISLFIQRGADPWVAVAFGAGLPFFEIALALTDSMLRRYTVSAPGVQVAAEAHTGTPQPTKAAHAASATGERKALAVESTPATAVKNPQYKPLGTAFEIQVVPAQINNVSGHATLATQTDAEIANALGVTRQSVNNWRRAGNLEGQIAKRLPAQNFVTVNGNGAHA